MLCNTRKPYIVPNCVCSCKLYSSCINLINDETDLTDVNGNASFAVQPYNRDTRFSTVAPCAVTHSACRVPNRVSHLNAVYEFVAQLTEILVDAKLSTFANMQPAI